LVTGHFAYETFRLLDTSPTTWTFRLHDISPPVKLPDRRNLWTDRQTDRRTELQFPRQINIWSKIWRTGSSAITEGPRNTLSLLKSCQLLRNCTENRIWLQGLLFPVV